MSYKDRIKRVIRVSKAGGLVAVIGLADSAFSVGTVMVEEGAARLVGLGGSEEQIIILRRLKSL
jgi:fructose-1,6-bisphosphatase/sedoheptulose 1,7-bisphosphatase-like protein